eukprot:TRINITY_DN21690_c0_g1_i4.p1 TRINITY_DN21690_c0_g1~~TRINITY_DN21690_c0_g1_i4.p1  ORF type:complete len:418 (+),score=60.86 TRINITY_DN21690_c0_g1_i4:57-1310(+)
MCIVEVSRLDQVYRSVLLSRFFTRGWGKPNTLENVIRLRKDFGNREVAQKYFVPLKVPVKLTKQENQDGCVIIDGEFRSPLCDLLPGVLPPESEVAYFQAVLPEKWKNKADDRNDKSLGDKPLVVHFAGTGDHYFWRRRTLMAKPLITEMNVGSIILENPYYGLRKPKDQLRSALHYVSDLFVMGAAIIIEAQVLLKWAERQGFGPLCCHGISMGGHMASLAASAWPHPICLVPCLSWTSASVTFCQGVMANAINWRQLHEQFEQNVDYKDKVLKLISSPEFQYQGGYSSDSFLRDSFLAPDSRVRLDNFRDINTQSKTSAEAFTFMRGLMDECTHLGNYSVPVDTDIIEIVAAQYDAYQPRKSIKPLDKLWPGSNIRYVAQGHVSSYLFHQKQFRDAIYDSLATYNKKYSSSSSIS